MPDLSPQAVSWFPVLPTWSGGPGSPTACILSHALTSRMSGGALGLGNRRKHKTWPWSPGVDGLKEREGRTLAEKNGSLRTKVTDCRECG